MIKLMEIIRGYCSELNITSGKESRVKFIFASVKNIVVKDGTD